MRWRIRSTECLFQEKKKKKKSWSPSTQQAPLASGLWGSCLKGAYNTQAWIVRAEGATRPWLVSTAGPARATIAPVCARPATMAPRGTIAPLVLLAWSSPPHHAGTEAPHFYVTRTKALLLGLSTGAKDLSTLESQQFQYCAQTILRISCLPPLKHLHGVWIWRTLASRIAG